MDDLQSPNQEHLRVSPTDERLRSFPSDRTEAWGIAIGVPLTALVYGAWDALPTAAAVGAVLAAILLGSAAISRVWRKLFRHRNIER
jgi:hypothetical protein